MAADIESCLTEVRCPTTSGYGTGYLIAPDLVLTACHVIVEALNASLPSDLTIEVRTLAHFNKGVAFRSAALIWPSPDKWAQFAPLDIALLQIAPDAITGATAQRVRLGREGLPQDKELQVHFSGFPRLMTMPDSEARDVKQTFGEIAPISGAKQNLNEITVKGKPAKSDDAWKGVSGAAVFAQGQIIAVVNIKLTDAMVDFYASRIDGALRDQEFRDRVATSQAAISTRVSVASDLNLFRLVCLIDRDPQETAFRTAFRELVSAQRVRPLCCLIYGGARHRPLDLADRFSLVTIPELRKLRPGEALPFKPINWPSGEVDVAAGLASLRALLWNVLSDEDGSEPPTEPLAYMQRLSDESRPHFFVTELSPAQLTAASAALWSAWLLFLDSVAACELTRPPLHVFLVRSISANGSTSASRGSCRRWRPRWRR
jgi:hypothetical protein